MTIPDPSPAYRADWRANKTGTWSHAVVAFVHPWVESALLSDPNGGPFFPDDLRRMLDDCASRNTLARMERLGDKRCRRCLDLLADLERGRRRAAELWAIDLLRTAIDALAEHAPILPAVDRG